MTRPGVLDDLIRRARRRCLSNLLVEQTVQAACVAMSGLILLLVVGTEILDARWLVALFIIGLAVGFRNLRRGMPTCYAVAQSVDRKAGLHDAVSTAFFYRSVEPDRKAPEELRAAQLAQAERLAREVPVAKAFPYVVPKSLYFMSVLGLIASSLIAVRYGISRSLDLHPPLSQIVLDIFHFAEQPARIAKKDAPQKNGDDLLKQFGLSLDNKKGKPGADPEQPASDQTLAPSETRQGQQPARQDSLSVDPKNQQPADEEADASAAGQSPENRQNQSASSRSDSSGEAPGERDAQQASNSQRENNSLLDKFRDAMANLMSRLKSQPRNGQGQQMASRQSQGRPDEQGRESQGQKGGQQAAGRQLSQNGQPQGEQEGEGDQKSQAGAGKQSGNESERSSQEGRSGIGKEDGSKAVRDAEQLAAMGKISQILGKRSQTLTGDMMVEVNSGKEQPLRTAYSQQTATHADTGGEIHRDEIPLAYQRYVQQYFEEIRKAAPPAPKPAPPAAPNQP